MIHRGVIARCFNRWLSSDWRQEDTFEQSSEKIVKAKTLPAQRRAPAPAPLPIRNTASHNREPNPQHDVIRFALRLNIPFSQIEGIEEQFCQEVISDVASSLRVDRSKLYVFRLEAGSIIVTMGLHEDACGDGSRTAAELVDELVRQASDSSSPLCDIKMRRYSATVSSLRILPPVSDDKWRSVCQYCGSVLDRHEGQEREGSERKQVHNAPSSIKPLNWLALSQANRSVGGQPSGMEMI